MKNSKIMGILNCTPDSYYDGGWGNYIRRAKEMKACGADLLDLGGASSAPGREIVTEKEELLRVIPVIECLKQELSIPLSIDTFRPKVARAAIHAGATFLNDITGGDDPEMRALAREYGLTICINHLPNPPGSRFTIPDYPKGIVEETYDWIRRRVDLLLCDGIKDSQIVIDPGFGFGKSIDDQYLLIKHLKRFKDLGFPVLVSLSRKSFMYKFLGSSPEEVLPTTLCLNTMALLAGVEYLRVHDVKEHHEILTVLRHMEALG